MPESRLVRILPRVTWSRCWSYDRRRVSWLALVTWYILLLRADKHRLSLHYHTTTSFTQRWVCKGSYVEYNVRESMHETFFLYIPECQHRNRWELSQSAVVSAESLCVDCLLHKPEFTEGDRLCFSRWSLKVVEFFVHGKYTLLKCACSVQFESNCLCFLTFKTIFLRPMNDQYTKWGTYNLTMRWKQWTSDRSPNICAHIQCCILRRTKYSNWLVIFEITLLQFNESKWRS